MNLSGIWKGEYTTQWFPVATGREVPLPFVMKIRMVNDLQGIPVENGMIEGICQDDPAISKMTLHAPIAGSVSGNRIFLIKQYPKLLIRNASDQVEIYDGLNPELIYTGEFRKDGFTGTWLMNRTFRKINDRLVELRPMKGTWKMNRLNS